MPAAQEEDVAPPPRTSSRDKRERSLPDLGWWLIDQALEGNVTPAMLSSIGGIMRLLATQPGVDDADTLREVELRGRLMHGLPPREEEEWELARALFDDDAWRSSSDGKTKWTARGLIRQV